ncbi:MAG: peptidoglycan editing factor PgeF [Oscillospiraceae bacterium]|jgi:YfiH family protein|nr:peptidoglycan editing factor PgeF [Oscillospiraceae bacterium]
MEKVRYAFGTKMDTAESLGFANAAKPKQVRGGKVVAADELPCEADAVVTNLRNFPICVSAADCVPVLMYDPAANCIAAVHSGWQGTELNIAAKTVAKLTELYGSAPADIQAYIGPAIGGECYEVGDEVIAKVRGTISPDSGAGIVDGFPKNIDLRAVVAEQLREAGVTRIDIHSDCVRCKSDIYWSRRAELAKGGAYQNNISVIEIL